ncbi:MAG TPA: TetR/AcrR family transcriptional regulator [Steroidobacteraceae bacterium]
MTTASQNVNRRRIEQVVGRPRQFNVEQSLERAMRLFWRQGYEGTSLADLTRELGLSRPSLYAAFGSKEALFLKALDLYEAQAGYRRAALAAPTAREYARALLEGAADLHGDKRNPPGCLGVQGALACGPGTDAIRKELMRRRKIGEGIVRDRLRRAQTDGDFPARADPEDWARYLSIVIYGITVQAAGGATRGQLRNAAQLALRNWP